MTYTKGEWIIDRVKKSMIISPRKDKVICRLGYSGELNDDDRANAHLIAAAPDMYEALKALAHDFATLGELYGITPDGIKKVLNKSERALAKAEGR